MVRIKTSPGGFPLDKCNTMYSWLNQHVHRDVFVCSAPLFFISWFKVSLSLSLLADVWVCKVHLEEKRLLHLKGIFQNSSVGSSFSSPELTENIAGARAEHMRDGRPFNVCLPRTSPGPAIRGGSCGCCRAQWARGEWGCRLSHPGLSPLLQRFSFYIKPPDSAGLRYSCGCNPTTLLSTSWKQRGAGALVCVQCISLNELHSIVLNI